MTKDLWINLPVKDVNKSKAFFSQLGFEFNLAHSKDEVSACMLIGKKNVVVMLFAETIFRGFVRSEISNPGLGSEVLFSFDGESREEVDTMAKKVEAAGGIIFGKPAEVQGWMYGFGFADPDGHKWNMIYMDESKLPKQ